MSNRMTANHLEQSEIKSDPSPWLPTRSGLRYHILNPQPDDIYIVDIAWALSHECRYNGHGNRHYSVAEHSLLMADMLRSCEYPPSTQLFALLHDASEAYLKDIPRPIKRLLPDYVLLERLAESAIIAKFGLDDELGGYESRAIIKKLDSAILYYEQRHLGLKEINPNCQQPEEAYKTDVQVTRLLMSLDFDRYIGMDSPRLSEHFLWRARDLFEKLV